MHTLFLRYRVTRSMSPVADLINYEKSKITRSFGIYETSCAPSLVGTKIRTSRPSVLVFVPPSQMSGEGVGGGLINTMRYGLLWDE